MKFSIKDHDNYIKFPFIISVERISQHYFKHFILTFCKDLRPMPCDLYPVSHNEKQKRPMRMSSENRPFSYSGKSQNRTVFCYILSNFRICTKLKEVLTPLNRTSCIKMYKNSVRSSLFCRIAKRSIHAQRKQGTQRPQNIFYVVDLMQSPRQEDFENSSINL